MTGDGASRFCTHCQKHVHNLSAMRADDAQRLICNSAGPLCIAYVPDDRGAPTTLAYAPQRRPRYGWRLVATIATIGGAASAFATVLYRPKPPPAPPVIGSMIRGKMMVMGDMVVAPPPTNTPTSCPVGGLSGT
jgi:hypothetical protein